MTRERVTQYSAMLYFRREPNTRILLYRDDAQIGEMQFIDPAFFNATIDLLRNEGPYIEWDNNDKVLYFGVEPVGEGES